MEKKRVKWLRAFLSAAVFVCVLGITAPVTVKAAEVDPEDETVLIVSEEDTAADVTNAWTDNISTVRFDESVSVIKTGILSWNTAVTKVEIMGTVTSIEEDAFRGCRNLSTVTGLKEGLTSIGQYAFADCSFTDITIPGSVTTIDYGAFFNCSQLESVTFSENSQLTTIGGIAFMYCRALTSIAIPDSVKMIGGIAFCDCSQLETFYYPAGLDIGNIDLEAGVATISYVDKDGKRVYTCDGEHDIVDKGNGTVGCSRCDYIYEPKITQQPVSRTVTEGEEAFFTVTAEGDGELSYRWQVDRNDGNGWTDIDGATGTTYTLSGVETGWSGWQYRCIVTDSKGSGHSEAAVLTVKAKETEITESPVPTEPAETPEYHITEGANASWTKGSTDGLVLKGDGDYGKLTGVKVDGAMLDGSDYEAVSGSTVITLKAEYLNTLLPGNHTVAIVWQDGSAETVITIADNSAGNVGGGNNGDGGNGSGGSSNSSGGTDDVPETGEEIPVAVLSVLMLISGAGIAAAGKKRTRG